MPPRAKRRPKTDKPPPKVMNLCETFLVNSAMQMHQEALVENQESLKNWEWFLRHNVFNDQRYGLVTQLMYSYPKKLKTSVRLNQAFPVLKGAAITAEQKDFFEKKLTPAEFKDLTNVQVFFSAVFKTRHHGYNNLIGISVLKPTDKRYSSRLQLGALTDSEKPTELETDGLTLSMTNLSDEPDNISLFMVTMIVPFHGCMRCGSIGSTTTPTRTQMHKCGRCWELLHFPIWYCCAECQRVDFPRHRAMEGCGGKRTE